MTAANNPAVSATEAAAVAAPATAAPATSDAATIENLHHVGQEVVVSIRGALPHGMPGAQS